MSDTQNDARFYELFMSESAQNTAARFLCAGALEFFFFMSGAGVFMSNLPISDLVSW